MKIHSMAAQTSSRKHSRESTESQSGIKRPFFLDGSQNHQTLRYNPGFLGDQRTSEKCPSYTYDELRDIAKQLGIKPGSKTKKELVAAIRTQTC